MASSILLIDISKFDDRLIPLVKDFEHGPGGKIIISFSLPIIWKIKEIVSPSVEVTWSQEVLADDFEIIDEAAYSIIRGWHDGKGFSSNLIYNGVNLGATVEHSLSLVLPQLLKKIKLVKKILQQENPGQVTVISNNSLLADICENVKSGLSLSLNIQSIVWNEENCQENFFRPEIGKLPIIDFLGGQLMRMFGFFFKKKSVERKEAILVRNPKQLSTLLSKDYKIIFCAEKINRELTLGVLRKKVPCHIANALFARDKNKMKKLWGSLNNGHEFKKIFIFEEVDFWPLLKKDFKKIFITAFPFYIGYIKKADKIIQKTKPALMISTPGVTAPDRILFELADKYNIPSLDIQHGLLGDRRAREIIYASCMAVWGEATRRQLVNWGNNEDKIFVTGNYKFDNYKNTTGLIPREDLCSQLGIDPTKKFFVWATGVYFADNLPYVSAVRTPDEGRVIFTSILKVLEKFPEKQLVVKTHPMEKLEGYLDILENFPSLEKRVKVIKQVHLYSLLKESELLFTRGSTTDLEAMFFGKPIIAMNFSYDNDFFYKFDMVGCPVLIVKDRNRLYEMVQSVLTDNSLLANLHKSQEKFIQEFAGEMDGRSGERLTAAIKKIVQNNS